MATELAKAYVTLIPSLKGADKTIRSELAGIDLSSSGSRMGDSLAGGMVPKMKAASTAIIATLGGIGGAIGSIAATGGMARALNLEQAQTMFKGLKLDWADYEQTVNDAVNGTAFSLDSAALVAAQLASSGVGAGEQMKTALNACVGAAATFGTELGDVGGIFQKVAAKGKLSGDELFQLNARGINALSVLSQYLGKTQDEVSQMVSKGQIDFQTFSDAMYAAFGDSAQAANETFAGSFANMGSALSRIGAKFATPFKDACIPVLNAVRTALNGVNEALTPLADRFGEFAGIVSDKLVSKLTAFSDAVEHGGSMMDGLKAALGPIGSIVAAVVAGVVGLGAAFGSLGIVASVVPGLSALFGAFSGGAGTVGILSGAVGILKGSLSALVSPLGMALAAASLLSGAFVGLMGSSSGFRNAVDSIIPQAGALRSGFDEFIASIDGGRSAIDAMADAMQAMFGSVDVQSMLGSAADWLRSVAELAAPAIAEVVGGAISGAQQLLSTLMPVVSGLVDGVVGFASAFTDALGGSGALQSLAIGAASLVSPFGALRSFVSVFGKDLKILADTIGSNIAPVLTSLGRILGGVIAAALPAIQSAVTAMLPAVQAIMTAITQVVSAVLPVLASLLEQLAPIIVQIAGFIGQVVSALAPLISALVTTLMPVITNIVQAVMNFVTAIMPAVIAVLNVVMSVIQALLPVVTSIIEVVVAVVSAIVSAIGTVITVVTNVAAVIAGVVSDIITVVSGIVSVIVEVFGVIAGTVTEAIATVVTVISQGFGMASNIVGTVANTIGSFVVGLLSTIGNVFNAIVTTITGAVSSAFSAAQSAFGNIVSTVSSAVGNVLGTVGSIPGKIVGFFSNAGRLLVDAGRNIIDGFLSGLKGAWDNVTGFIGGIGNWIAQHKGPKEYDLQLLVPNGGWIMESLSRGLKKGIPQLKSTLSDVADEVGGYTFAVSSPSMPKVAPSASASTGGQGDHVQRLAPVLHIDIHDCPITASSEQDVDRFAEMLSLKLQRTMGGLSYAQQGVF